MSLIGSKAEFIDHRENSTKKNLQLFNAFFRKLFYKLLAKARNTRCRTWTISRCAKQSRTSKI